MKICWVGFHAEGLAALRAVVEAGHDVAAVITLTPEAAARRSGASDYRSLCDELGLPLYDVGNINDEESLAILRSVAPQLLIVLGWSQILREPALSIPTVGVVGAHASLLPKNRGRAPVNWSIIRGEKLTGNTLMWLAAGVDSGDIIDQKAIPIEDYDTCATLYEKVAATNREMVLDLLDRLERGERPGYEQPHSDDPLLPGRQPADGVIDWNLPAVDVYNLVRGVTRPYPGAFSFLESTKTKIWTCALLPLESPLATAGTVLGPLVSPDPRACGQVVACGAGAVAVLEAETEDEGVFNGLALLGQDWRGKVFDDGR